MSKKITTYFCKDKKKIFKKDWLKRVTEEIIIVSRGHSYLIKPIKSEHTLWK